MWKSRRRHERCWLDFDNDGNRTFIAGMWVAAGMRVFGQSHFHGQEQEKIRALYRRHMAGNTCTEIWANGQFQNVAMQAGVEMGGWSWSTMPGTLTTMATGPVHGQRLHHRPRRSRRLQLLLAPGVSNRRSMLPRRRAMSGMERD